MTVPYTPIWLQPNVGGMLSNKNGSDLAANAIQLKARYSNPGAAQNPVGTIRCVALVSPPIAASGNSSTQIWDSFWLGTGNIQLLWTQLLAAGPNCQVVYNNRLYIYGQGGFLGAWLYSHPINGNSVGPGRLENGVPTVGTGGYNFSPYLPAQSILVLNGVMYALIQTPVAIAGTGIYYASILGDGSIGNWTLFSSPTTPIPIGVDGYLTGYSDNTGAYLMYIAPGGGTTYYTTLAQDGSFSGTWTSVANAPTNYRGSAYFCQPSGNNDGKATLYVIGGAVAGPTTAVSTISKSAVTSGAPAAFTTLATGLPAARANFGFHFSGPDSQNDYQLVIVGGNSGNAYPVGTNQPAAGQTSTCWYIRASQLGNAWTAAGALSVAVDGSCCAFIPNLPGMAWTLADVYAVGGNSGGGGSIIQSEFQHSRWTTGSKPAFTSPPGWPSTGNPIINNALQVSDLVSGGAITYNPDGTIDVTFLYGFDGTAIAGGIPMGSTVTLNLYFTDNQGDVSNVAVIVFTVGTAPSIASVAPGGTLTITTPTFTFQYKSGNGGLPESAWQLKILQGSTVIYDSGLQQGQANSQAVSTIPVISNGTYSLLITVTSFDNPLPGSSNQNLFASSIIFNAAAGSVPN